MFSDFSVRGMPWNVMLCHQDFRGVPHCHVVSKRM